MIQCTVRTQEMGTFSNRYDVSVNGATENHRGTLQQLLKQPPTTSCSLEITRVHYGTLQLAYIEPKFVRLPAVESTVRLL